MDDKLTEDTITEAIAKARASNGAVRPKFNWPTLTGVYSVDVRKIEPDAIDLAKRLRIR